MVHTTIKVNVSKESVQILAVIENTRPLNVMNNSAQPTNQRTKIHYQEALKILSPREIEVLDFVEKGMTNHEIAEEMNLSIRTIHTHSNNICDKLGIDGRLGLIKWLWHHKKGKYDESL